MTEPHKQSSPKKPAEEGGKIREPEAEKGSLSYGRENQHVTKETTEEKQQQKSSPKQDWQSTNKQAGGSHRLTEKQRSTHR